MVESFATSRGMSQLQRLADPLRLRLVLEVERHGSISRAAEACEVSQPTASMHLRKLETAVGQRLLERSRGATRLTDAGRVVAQYAAVVLSALEGLEQELRAVGDAVTGTLQVAACESFGTYVLPRVLADFTVAHPGAHIELRVEPSGDVARDVARGDAQVGIAGELRRLTGLAYTDLMTDELTGIASPEAAHLHGSLEAAALANEVLVVPAKPSSTRAITMRVARRLGWVPERMLEVHAIESLKRAVMSGVGVAITSRLAVVDEVGRHELGEFSLRGVGPIQRRLELLRPANRRPAPLEVAFEQSLRQLALVCAIQLAR
jgi:LysR family transcriptional regulator, transcriptional activator of the cysJI operon